MSPALLRGHGRLLGVNIVAFSFDGERDDRRRCRGSLIIEVQAACDRLVLDEMVRNREAMVLERPRTAAIEMRLAPTAAARRDARPAPSAGPASYRWMAP